jgi:hypothetical protein
VSKREVISSFPKSRHKNEQLQAQALHAKDRASQVTQLCCAIGSAKRGKKKNNGIPRVCKGKRSYFGCKIFHGKFLHGRGEAELNSGLSRVMLSLLQNVAVVHLVNGSTWPC